MAVSSENAGNFFFVLEDPVRILFVDDDPILREFAIVHLSTEQAQVEVSPDGEAALELIAAADFDIILLDLEMPRLDGFAVLDRLRADERTQNLPVIVVTGREDMAAIDRAFTAGATSFLVKPINWRLLSYQIRYVQRAHRFEMSLREARSRAREEASQAAEMLRQVAQDSAALIQLAMGGGDPTLRQAALAFAERFSRAMDGEAA